MRHRCAEAVAAVAALLMTGAAPAWAHQEISPGSVPPGRPAFLVLSAANEKRVDLTSVSIVPPSGGEFGHATRDPAGWTATLSHTNVRWTGGAVKPERFEQWGFEVEGFDQPGTFTYRVTLGYADGTSQEVEVPVTVGQAVDAAPVVTAAPTTAAIEATTPTAAGGTDDANEAAGAVDGDEGSDGEALATVALAVSVLALVATVVALASRRRPAPASAPTTGGQDW